MLLDSRIPLKSRAKVELLNSWRALLRLLIKTSEIVRLVVAGESIIIEKRGVPVAEIRLVSDLPKPHMPDREALIMSGPETDG
jgi:antitoxin (DNA-binding transcriptional repressor) of toxin-antitoxin stability system